MQIRGKPPFDTTYTELKASLCYLDYFTDSWVSWGFKRTTATNIFWIIGKILGMERLHKQPGVFDEILCEDNTRLWISILCLCVSVRWPSISLPLHSSKRIESMLTACLIRLHYWTLFVVYNDMMPWALHCKIREELIHQTKELHNVSLKHWTFLHLATLQCLKV